MAHQGHPSRNNVVARGWCCERFVVSEDLDHNSSVCPPPQSTSTPTPLLLHLLPTTVSCYSSLRMMRKLLLHPPRIFLESPHPPFSYVIYTIDRYLIYHNDLTQAMQMNYRVSKSAPPVGEKKVVCNQKYPGIKR